MELSQKIKICKYCNKEFHPFINNKNTQVTCGAIECKKKRVSDYDRWHDRTLERKKQRRMERVIYFSNREIKTKWDKYQEEYRKTYYLNPEKRERILERTRNNFKIPERRARKMMKMKQYRKTFNGRLIQKMARCRRRAAKKYIIESFTKEQWREKLKATNGICPGINKICYGKTSNVGIDNLTLDHMYEVSKAYKDYLQTGVKRIYTIDDIQPLCQSCNSKKNFLPINLKPKALYTSDSMNNNQLEAK